MSEPQHDADSSSFFADDADDDDLGGPSPSLAKSAAESASTFEIPPDLVDAFDEREGVRFSGEDVLDTGEDTEDELGAGDRLGPADLIPSFAKSASASA